MEEGKKEKGERVRVAIFFSWEKTSRSRCEIVPLLGACAEAPEALLKSCLSLMAKIDHLNAIGDTSHHQKRSALHSVWKRCFIQSNRRASPSKKGKIQTPPLPSHSTSHQSFPQRQFHKTGNGSPSPAAPRPWQSSPGPSMVRGKLESRQRRKETRGVAGPKAISCDARLEKHDERKEEKTRPQPQNQLNQFQQAWLASSPSSGRRTSIASSRAGPMSTGRSSSSA